MWGYEAERASAELVGEARGKGWRREEGWKQREGWRR